MPPILLVEDSPEDLEAMLRAFKRAGIANPVVHCRNGDEALDYLFQRGPHAGSEAPPPVLVLLDLNLPGTDGREVLIEIKQSADMRHIPVIVMSTSAEPRDVHSCYACGANAFIQKPAGGAAFMKAIARTKEYWFETAVLPDSETRR
jgi:two-component system response regulator